MIFFGTGKNFHSIILASQSLHRQTTLQLLFSMDIVTITIVMLSTAADQHPLVKASEKISSSLQSLNYCLGIEVGGD